jgi:hypothetical protein
MTWDGMDGWMMDEELRCCDDGCDERGKKLK